MRKWPRIGCVVVAVAAFSVACGGGGNGPKLTAVTTTKVTSGASGSAGSGAVTTTVAPVVTTTIAATPPSVFTTTPAGAVPGPVKLTDAAGVTTAGLGPLTFGLTAAAAEKAIGTRLLPDAAFPGAAKCVVLKPESGPDGVRFTVTSGTIERLDIQQPSKLKTKSGAGLASTEAQLKALYADRLTFTATPQGKTVIYTPQDASNASFRLIFQLDLSGAVTSFRSGRVGAIESVNPCG